ncbi:hypothetical protein PHMEG_00021093 [Phytophthora megakarya]|uniref:Uncharacterized protein n=1 Tax=Phytophthora megakarya TaxID=4795 RepID=A0A225VPE9_9STRA|nr:hypothetical protein PHMEG_00021093 [Phytophthora megakarya]
MKIRYSILYSDKADRQRRSIPSEAAGVSVRLSLRQRLSIHDKLCVTRGDRWVPTISNGPGMAIYI